MEEILIALFGGGICDWQDISQTKYDWEEIIGRAKERYGFDVDINCLYETILNMALEDLNDLIEDYIAEANTEEEKTIAEQLEKVNIEDDFDIWCNCLDTHLNYIGDEEIGRIIQDIFEDKIDKIDENIGFTYIDFNN